MKVVHVSLRATDAANAAGRPALTPELLAVTGARYSRSDEGLDAILAKIDPDNPDKSVDSIFKMVDYGHQSIADMVPVALFIDGVSLLLAYLVWSLCPTAGGQESSTRYICMRRSPAAANVTGADGLVGADALGLPDDTRADWEAAMSRAFAAYETAVTFWEGIADTHPELSRIPRKLLDDPGERARKTVARMRRNYAFDRARYFLPVAARTNLMLVQSARAWVTLASHLLSHPLPEARTLGAAIRGELALVAPRLLKHAVEKPSLWAGQAAEWTAWRDVADARYLDEYAIEFGKFERESGVNVGVWEPFGGAGKAFAGDLVYHDNRYAPIGETLRRTTVRFSWQAVAFAEIRDLNRHRTGTKYCPLLPVGFYGALDQLPAGEYTYNLLIHQSGEASLHARRILQSGEPTGIYHTLLGTQFPFEHTTTADKFLYEAELRTGVGAHFRYAAHLKDALALWYERYPDTRGLVLEGSAEPE